MRHYAHRFDAGSERPQRTHLDLPEFRIGIEQGQRRALDVMPGFVRGHAMPAAALASGKQVMDAGQRRPDAASVRRRHSCRGRMDAAVVAAFGMRLQFQRRNQPAEPARVRLDPGSDLHQATKPPARWNATLARECPSTGTTRLPVLKRSHAPGMLPMKGNNADITPKPKLPWE